jgi:tetratricopeptide (TPR) repeat protein
MAGAAGKGTDSSVKDAAVDEMQSEHDLIAPLRARLDRNRELVGRAEAGSQRQAELLLMTGDPERAWEIVQAAPDQVEMPGWFSAQVAFVLHDFESVRFTLEQLLRTSTDRNETRRLQIKWFLASDNLEGLERYCGRILEAEPSCTPALLGSGWLALKLMDYEAARDWFDDALAFAADSRDSVRALEGMADVFYEEQQFESSLDYLKRALPLRSADDRLLESLALTLIRLGRVGEAIDAAELAVELNPFNERAQYTLGNGYSRLNYSELQAAHPKAFPEPSEAGFLALIDSLMAAGARNEARNRLLEIAGTRTNLTDVHVRLGSLAFENGDFDAALGHFRNGLSACLGNGRARNGISKALEAKRLLIDVHREDYERRFAETPWPEVPGIEDFVLNWSSLSDRHKKRVAMSIEPWKQFIPVLIASGSTYYIKPLYQRLSECPGLETLKDQRIDYDSRLWDDVRGCGGYTTVTGIEDVERTVLNQYNTVLHELTHQVHAVLTADENRVVQDLYRKAKEGEAAGEEIFISRYQASSVWEYLAEGANSLMTPRRDDYDTRQIVRERLEERDQELAAIVLRLMSVDDMEPYYAVGFSNSGYDKIEKNLADEAVDQFEKALRRNPRSPEGQAGLIYASSIKGRHGSSCALAEHALRTNPKNARVLIEASRAFYHRDGDIRARAAKLEAGRDMIEDREKYLIDLELAETYLTAGDIGPSIECFRRVLDYQDDNPRALWGMGMAQTLAGDFATARDYFDRAILRRSGLVDLRTDYAMALLDAGDLQGAEAQLSEAKLLDQEDSGVVAAEGRMRLIEGNTGLALLKLKRAVELAPHNDFARALLADAKLKSGDTTSAWNELQPLLDRVEEGRPPEYLYNEKKFAFEVIHEFPAYEQRMLYRVAFETAGELGNSEDAERFQWLSKEAVRLPK